MPSKSAQEWYASGFDHAKIALDHDEMGEVAQAISNFETSIAIFRRLSTVESTAKRQLLQQKIHEFQTRVEELRTQKLNSASSDGKPIANVNDRNEERAHAIWTDACRADIQENTTQPSTCKNVINKYIEAADMFLCVMKQVSETQEKESLELKLESIIGRVTELKSLMTLFSKQVQAPQHTASSAKRSAQSHHKHSQRAYTSDELDVLRRSSTVNGQIFLPWLDDIDVNEQFKYPHVFNDDYGLLTLSKKQKEHFIQWKRPSEILAGKHHASTYVMIEQISPVSIIQDIVTDCSFVASLCITAAYEVRFKKQLITRVIFPQNDMGNPIYNPSGKYMVKLWINGIPRKIIVDDLLPVDKRDNLLCSYTTTANELWVSIIEKAYMKLNGGYDFPGSNSGIDLFALTGWIPESLSFEGSTAQDFVQLWERLRSAHEFGDCLITIATGNTANASGEIADDSSFESQGLACFHAYAVLDVRDICGHQLLQVKNPWRKQRWTGPFSAHDERRWTPELRQALAYDPHEARESDDGIFWIDYTSVCTYFRGLFLNWNPALFYYQTALHKHWSMKIGPRKDTYNLGDNPQYSLKVQVARDDAKPGQSKLQFQAPQMSKCQSVWILLTRHVTEQVMSEEEREQDYLTLHVFSRRHGKRIYHPHDAHRRGTYSNNPHCLTCLDVPEGEHDYTLVVSQYEKVRNMDYTISIYSTTPFRLGEPPASPPMKHRVKSEWHEDVMEGLNNPQWEIQVPPASPKDRHNSPASFFLETSVKVLVNLRVFRARGRISSLNQVNEVKSSGEYRSGFCYVDVDQLDPGHYIVVPSTYEPARGRRFTLTMKTTDKISITKLSPEGEGYVATIVHGKWSLSKGTAAGCTNFGHYCSNPQYRITFPPSSPPHDPTIIFAKLQVENGANAIPEMNVSMFPTTMQTSASPANAILTSNKGMYVNPPAGVETPVLTLPSAQQPQSFIFIPSTFHPARGKFKLLVYTSHAITIQELNHHHQSI